MDIPSVHQEAPGLGVKRFFTLPGLLLAGAIILLAVEMIVLLFLREVWVDELFSAWKGLLVLKGELTPFLNGLFEYPPLVVPTYGLVQFLFGPDILVGRILSVVFFAGGALLLFRAVSRLAGSRAATALLWLIASNLLLLGNFASATMYSMMFLLLSGVVYAETSSQSRQRKIVLQSILLALAILGRTNMLAAAIAYLVFLVIVERRAKSIAFSIVVIAVVVVLGYLPVVLQNPPLALAHLLSVFGNLGPLKDLPASLKVGSLDLARFLEVFTTFIKEYLGFLILFVVSASLLCIREGRSLLAFLRREPTYTLLATLSFVLLAAHYFYPRIVGHVYYANYFVPFLLAAATVSVWRFFGNDRVLKILVVAVVILTGLLNLFRTDVISNPREESDLVRIRRGARLLSEYTKPTDRIIAFDNSLIHLFSSGQKTYLPLLNRDFLYLPDADSAKVTRMGFYNLAMIADWLRSADYLVIHKERWSIPYKRSPFWGEGSEDTRARLFEIQNIIDETYAPVAEAENVYPRKYTKGNDGGTLVLYRRMR